MIKNKYFLKRILFLVFALLIVASLCLPLSAAEFTFTPDYSLLPGWNRLNVANVGALPITDNSNGNNIISINEATGSFALETVLLANSSGEVHPRITLRELCPYMEVGKTYYMSWDSDYGHYVYFYGGPSISINQPFVATDELLDKMFVFYGYDVRKNGLPDGYSYGQSFVVEYTNFMISQQESQEFVSYSETLAYMDELDEALEQYYASLRGEYTEQIEDEAFSNGYADGYSDGVLQKALINPAYMQMQYQVRNRRTNSLHDYWFDYPVPSTLLQGYTFEISSMPNDFFEGDEDVYVSNFRVNLLYHDRVVYLDTEDIYIKNTTGNTRVTITYLGEGDTVEDEWQTKIYTISPTGEDGYVLLTDELNGVRVLGVIFEFVTVKSADDYGYYPIGRDIMFSFTSGSYVFGYQTGLDKGLEQGYNKGEADTVKNYTDNILPAYKADIEKELQETFDKELASEVKNAKQLGYNEGYREGAKADSKLSTVIMAPVDSVVKLFYGFLDFNILGVNMSAFVSSLITVCLVVAVIKFVI